MTDSERFVLAFQELERAQIPTGMLPGPIKVPRDKFVPANIPVLIGKVTTHLQEMLIQLSTRSKMTLQRLTLQNLLRIQEMELSVGSK